MLKNCDNQFKFGRFRNKMFATENHKILTSTTKLHRSNQKQSTRSFGNASSGNRARSQKF